MRMKVDALMLTTFGRFVDAGMIEPLTLTKSQEKLIVRQPRPYNYKFGKPVESDGLRERIVDLRLRKGIKQGEMADYIGISRMLYHHCEHGRAPMRELYVMLIAEKLGVTEEELLKEE